MDHAMTVLRDDVHVDGIFTLYYFEFGVNYHFPGERHDFWEMIYVDAGELTVNTESGFVLLRRGDAVFHPPGFFHTCRGNEREPVNLIVMTFSLGGPGDAPLEPLKNRAVHLSERHAAALTAIVREAKKAFSTPLGSYIGRELVRSPSPAFGSEQLIRLYLEWMLIDLLRESPARPEAPPKTALRSTADAEKAAQIIAYLKENLRRRITVQEVSEYAALSPTRVKSLFRDATGVPLIAYANRLKIEEAKRLLRTGRYTVGETAEQLSYSSVQYFSHCFRKETGLTPTAYAASVKARTPVE